MTRKRSYVPWLVYGAIFLAIAGGTLFLTTSKGAELGFIKEEPVFITRTSACRDDLVRFRTNALSPS